MANWEQGKFIFFFKQETLSKIAEEERIDMAKYNAYWSTTMTNIMLQSPLGGGEGGESMLFNLK